MNMKRVVAGILGATMVLSLSACGGNSSGTSTGSNSGDSGGKNL